MHFIPSVARDAATKIAQTAKAGKAKIFLRRCAALCALLLCIWAFTETVYKVTAADWEAGRRAWKNGDCEAALAAWSRNAWARPFALRPARLYYWKIQALEKLGRADEAERFINFFGAEWFLYGTDYPMWNEEEELKRFLSLKLTSAQFESILGANAERVYRL